MQEACRRESLPASCLPVVIDKYLLIFFLFFYSAFRCCRILNVLLAAYRVTIFTHQRSEVDVFSGVCLSVCLAVCLFVNMITFERLNVGWWNLTLRCIVQKSHPRSNLEVKGQRSRTPGTKNENLSYPHWQWIVRRAPYGVTGWRQYMLTAVCGSGTQGHDPRGLAPASSTAVGKSVQAI